MWFYMETPINLQSSERNSEECEFLWWNNNSNPTRHHGVGCSTKGCVLPRGSEAPGRIEPRLFCIGTRGEHITSYRETSLCLRNVFIINSADERFSPRGAWIIFILLFGDCCCEADVRKHHNLEETAYQGKHLGVYDETQKSLVSYELNHILRQPEELIN